VVSEDLGDTQVRATPATPAPPATPSPGATLQGEPEDPAKAQDPAGLVAPLASFALKLDDGRRLLCLPRGCDGMLAPRALVLPFILNEGEEVGLGCLRQQDSVCKACQLVEKVVESGHFFMDDITEG